MDALRARERSENFLKHLLPRTQRLFVKASAVRKKAIEHVIDQRAGLVTGKRILQQAKITDAVAFQRADFAIDDAVGKRAAILCDLGKALGPVQRLARAQARRVAL